MFGLFSVTGLLGKVLEIQKLRKYSFLTKPNFNYYTQLKSALRLANVDRFTITNRRGYSISKRLVRLTRFQCYPLQVSGYQDIAPLLFVLRHQL